MEQSEITRIINEVAVLKKNQEDAKLELSKLKGQLEQEMKRLKADFDVDNLQAAIKELNKLITKLKKLDEVITDKFTILKESYHVYEGQVLQ